MVVSIKDNEKLVYMVWVFSGLNNDRSVCQFGMSTLGGTRRARDRADKHELMQFKKKDMLTVDIMKEIALGEGEKKDSGRDTLLLLFKIMS